MSRLKLTRTDGNETRALLKAEAQRLFARNGVDGVSVKDIVTAAGQRNNASLHYHFGSKEALIGELLVDGAEEIDAARQLLLEALLRGKDPVSVRATIEVLVRPVVELAQGARRGNTYIRFIANLQMNHRELFRSFLGDKWNAGYRRCLNLLRELLQDVPAPLLEQRLSMMGIYANAILAAREAALDLSPSPNRFWTPDYTLDNVIDTLEAVLECAPAPQTLARIAPQPAKKARNRENRLHEI